MRVVNERPVPSRLRTGARTLTLAVLVACAPDDAGDLGVVTSTTTASDLWRVTLPDGGTVPTGNVDLRLQVAPEDEPTDTAGFVVTLAASMPGMDMGADEAPVSCADASAGVYACALTLTMTGLWDLDGTIATSPDYATPDPFALRVEAR